MCYNVENFINLIDLCIGVNAMKNKIFIIFRFIVSIISLFLLMNFLSNAFTGILNIGNICGTFLCLWLLFVFTIRGIYLKYKSYMKLNKIKKYIYYILHFGISTFLIYGLILTATMFAFASVKPKENATAVVLGAQVQSQGPSVMLWGRINASRDYLNENPLAYAVVTGGKGDDEPMAEGECMYEKLVNYGISKNRIYVEDKAINTQENFEFSYKIIQKNNLNTDIVIVTDFFHQLRARIIARQVGIKGNVGAVNTDTTPLYYFPTFVVREWFALPYQVLFR